MANRKLPADFKYVEDMYTDEYFPNFLVDKVRDLIREVVEYIEEGGHSTEEIQDAFDTMTIGINELQDEFEENESEIETGARESIGATVDEIIAFFELDIDVEEAIRARDW